MTERAPAGEDRPRLPDGAARCAGFVGDDTHTRCNRRFDCARFLARSGPHTPFHISACGDGVDRFVSAHAPHDASPRESGESLAGLTRSGAGCRTSNEGQELAA